MSPSKLPFLYTSNGDEFVVIAHRGASAYAPENTHSAFKLAIEMQAEMIELDLLLSKDGVPVVIHEDELERTTGIIGLVSNYTIGELRDIDTGSWFSEEFKREPFPTLEEVLAYSKGKIAVNIEIKHESVTDSLEGGIVEKALELVKNLEMEDEVIFSSFDYRVMDHLNKLAPDISKALLYEEIQSNGLSPSQLVDLYKVDAFNCSYKELSQAWIDELNENKIPFFVYTINDEQLMEKVIHSGAKGIFTDKPDILIKVVENL
jgi:glycerophosphoryl diester phosphodiesterase